MATATRYQIKIRNAEQTDEFRIFDLTEAEWLHWRDVLVAARVCDEAAFRGNKKRLVVSYYPGTFPVSEEDDDILDLL